MLAMEFENSNIFVRYIEKALMDLIYTTLPEDQEQLGPFLKWVEEKLDLGHLACMNRLNSQSTYLWNGNLENGPEGIALLKTPCKHSELVQRELSRVHPYECPFIGKLSFDSVNDAFLEWVQKS